MDSTYNKALTQALKLLARKDFTFHQIKEKLSKKFPQNTVARVLEYLSTKNLLNDYRFALNYSQTKMEKGWGRRKIRYHLKLKGISEEVINTVENEIEFDYSFIEKELSRKYNLSNKKEKERATRFLSSRGFTIGEILNLLEKK